MTEDAGRAALARVLYQCAGAGICPSHDYHVEHATHVLADLVAAGFSLTPAASKDRVRAALEHFVESWGGNLDTESRLIDCAESYRLARRALAATSQRWDRGGVVL
jgi:hypothetical protein